MGDALGAILAWRNRAAKLRQLAAEARPTSNAIAAARLPLLDFIPAASPTFAKPLHLAPLVALLERAETEPIRTTISVPPRHAKTETLLHAIAWRLSRDPSCPIGYASYSAKLATSKSRLARDYAVRAGVTMRADANALSEWLTPAGGGLVAVGAGGPLTGHGFRLIIVDDPFANRQEAESPAIRQARHEWLTSTVETRLEPGGSMIVCHTRWHPDDLIGRLVAGVTPDRQKGTAWPSIRLQAIDDEGRALWPERWPSQVLQARREVIGEYDWASLYQQDPRPRGGQLFGEPARYDAPALDGARLVIACDPAASEKTHADYSAIVVLAVKGEGDSMTADVLDVHRLQVAIPALVDRLAGLQARHAAPIVVEAVGGFKAVPQMLEALAATLRVEPITPATDKFVRAQPVAAAWNKGRVRIPADATAHPWVVPLLLELRQFTGVKDRQDDQVDALAHAWNYAGAPTSYVGTVDEVSWMD